MSDGHDHLRAPYASASLRGYAGEVWERRDYVWYVPLSDLRSRHVNTVLGNLWHLLNPLLLIGVYFLIFGLLLKADRGVDNFIGFLAAGIFAFTYTQRTVQTSSSVMTRNIGLLNSFSFPRAILPLTSVVTEARQPLLVMMTHACSLGDSPVVVACTARSLVANLFNWRSAHRGPGRASRVTSRTFCPLRFAFTLRERVLPRSKPMLTAKCSLGSLPEPVIRLPRPHVGDPWPAGRGRRVCLPACGPMRC